MKQNQKESKNQINRVETTQDNLTGRGGMILFARYIKSVAILDILVNFFGHIRKSSKGISVEKAFKQILCFFYDGTSRHVSHFDVLKGDKGYAAIIETNQENMVSQHQVKRFFKMFTWLSGGLFRKVLKKMFLWRLYISKPKIIELTIDTMVMNNDESQKKHGCQPTYKKVKGFQPLQIIWQGKIVDAIFRGGKKHSNYGNTVVNMVTDLVKLIRKEYKKEVTIILKSDNGFFSEENFKAFDQLGILFISSGRIYDNTREMAASIPGDQWQSYENSHQKWNYAELGYRYSSWGKFYRAIYTKAVYDSKQMVFDFARSDSFIITNIGMNPELLSKLDVYMQAEIQDSAAIIKRHHQRGADELPHRGLKDFGSEELPFKRFSPNMAFYYCMLIAFFLFETFKEDVLQEVVPIGSYATTVRRKVLDFAAKIVKTAGQIVLKVTESTMKDVKFMKLWERSQMPIPIAA